MANLVPIEASFPDDFDQYPFSPAPVKLAVKDLFPRAEVQPAVRDGDHYFPSHDLALEVGVPVVLLGF